MASPFLANQEAIFRARLTISTRVGKSCASVFFFVFFVFFFFWVGKLFSFFALKICVRETVNNCSLRLRVFEEGVIRISEKWYTIPRVMVLDNTHPNSWSTNLVKVIWMWNAERRTPIRMPGFTGYATPCGRKPYSQRKIRGLKKYPDTCGGGLSTMWLYLLLVYSEGL